MKKALSPVNFLVLLFGLLMLATRSDAFRARRVNPTPKHTTAAFVVGPRGGADFFQESDFEDEENLVYEDAKEHLEQDKGNTTTVVEEAEEAEQPFDDPSVDEDSSANVDRMEYADAYDEEEVAEYTDYLEQAVEEEVPATTPSTQQEPVKEDTVEEKAEEVVSPIEQVALAQGIDEDGNQFIQLATSISPGMRQTLLKQLNYHRSDLRSMRPEIASILVAKNLQRPLEGLPDSWYTNGRAPDNSRTESIATKVAFCVAVCGVQMVLSGKISEALAEKLPFLSNDNATTEPNMKKSLPKPTEMVREKPAPEQLPKKEEDSGGVRPGGKPSSNKDEGWLDKRITAIAKAIDDFIDFLFRKR